MALDIYWQHGRTKKRIGHLETDEVLTKVFDEFKEETGFPIDPYSTTKLYISQWEKLCLITQRLGFHEKEERFQEIGNEFRILFSAQEGYILLEGD